MIIAIPLENGTLCEHFGHCKIFAFIEVDSAQKTILQQRDVEAPPHEPGLLPAWLAEHGITTVICGGIGTRAVTLLSQKGIETIIGSPTDTPQNLVHAFLEGRLKGGDNSCDH